MNEFILSLPNNERLNLYIPRLYNEDFVTMLNVDNKNPILKDENLLYKYFDHFITCEMKRNLEARIAESYKYKVNTLIY